MTKEKKSMWIGIGCIILGLVLGVLPFLIYYFSYFSSSFCFSVLEREMFFLIFSAIGLYGIFLWYSSLKEIFPNRKISSLIFIIVALAICVISIVFCFIYLSGTNESNTYFILSIIGTSFLSIYMLFFPLPIAFKIIRKKEE